MWVRRAVLFVLLVLAPASAWAEGEKPVAEATPESVAEATPEPAAAPEPLDERMITLVGLVRQIDSLDLSRRALSAAMDATPDRGAKEPLALQVDLLEQQIVRRRSDIARLITGLDPGAITHGGDESISWEDEAEELLAPVLSQLKQATERPRRIERLRGEVLHLEDRLKRVKEAQRVATDAVDRAPSEAARSELNLVRRAWKKKQAEVEQELQFTRLERDLAFSERSTVSGLGRSLFNLLFRSRGKNLALAVLVFLCMLVLVRVTHQVVLKVSKKVSRESVGMRLIELSIYAVGGLVAMFSMLGVLFASGDWVLLTLAALLFFGVIYSLRTGIPRFWSEIQLLLNIGSVREGERLVWQGVSWRVEKLAMLTVLANPAFPETRLRVPLSALHGSSSRPSTAGERWFPSELGDWVIWSDRAAHVLSQGPEFVTLRRDQSDVSVPTAEFLGSSPVNLSRGFRHRVVVTLDYRHQAIITDEVPTRLREHVAAALLREGVEAELDGLTVAFEAANASSLDVEIEVDFAGSAAEAWEHLEELIQAAAVDACNAEGWEIALPQLTVHQAG